MRLQEVAVILQRALPMLRLKVGGVPNQPNLLRLDGIPAVRAACAELDRVPGFAEVIADLRAMSVFALPEGQVVPQGEGAQFDGMVHALKDRAATLLPIVTALSPPVEELTLAVKLPPTQSIIEFRDDINDIVIAFDTATRVTLNEGVAFKGFDVGTEWVLIGCASVGVWILIKDMVRFAQECVIRQLQIKRMASAAEGFTETQKAMAAIAEQMAKDVVTLSDQHAAVLASKHAPEAKQKEAAAQIRIGIDRTMRLLSKGAEVQRGQLSVAMTADPRIPDLPDALELREALAPVVKLLAPGADMGEVSGTSDHATEDGSAGADDEK